MRANVSPATFFTRSGSSPPHRTLGTDEDTALEIDGVVLAPPALDPADDWLLRRCAP